MSNKKYWYSKDEGSTVGAIKGIQMPLGAKGKKKNNPNKPFGEDKLYEKKIMEFLEEELEETIEKRGDKWVVKDPLTGAERGSAGSRDAARALQKQLGVGLTRKKKPGQSAPPKERSTDLKGKAKTGTKKTKSNKPSTSFTHEHLKSFLKEKLKLFGFKASQITESSMISYMFEDKNKSSIWESFLGKLPKKMAMSDQGLSEMIKAMAVAEARVLARSVLEVKKVLENVGPFLVERKTADQDPETGDIRMPFTVSFGEGVEPLLFAVRLEGVRPCVLFPETSRATLNNSLTKESKLLRAELMHVQETVLDKIDDVIQAGLQRDAYLDEMQNRISQMVEGMNLVETAILRNVIKNKLKGAK